MPTLGDNRGRGHGHRFLEYAQQRTVRGRTGPQVPEDRIALVQPGLILLQRDKVPPADLADHHIQVPSAVGRTFPDQPQILRRKDDAAQAAHHIREFLDFFVVD